jgi:hypothetical protein
MCQAFPFLGLLGHGLCRHVRDNGAVCSIAGHKDTPVTVQHPHVVMPGSRRSCHSATNSAAVIVTPAKQIRRGGVGYWQPDGPARGLPGATQGSRLCHMLPGPAGLLLPAKGPDRAPGGTLDIVVRRMHMQRNAVGGDMVCKDAPPLNVLVFPTQAHQAVNIKQQTETILARCSVLHSSITDGIDSVQTSHR